MAPLLSRHHAARRAATALAVAAALVAGASPPSGAAAPRTPAVPVAPVQAGPDVVPAIVSPDLTGVAVDSAGFRAATDALGETTDALEAARSARAGAEGELGALATREAELTAAVASATVVRKAAAARLSRARVAIAALATEAYVNDASLDELSAAFRPEEVSSAIELRTYGRAGRTRVLAEERAARAERDAASGAVNRAQAERLGVRARTAEVAAARASAADDEVRLTARLAEDAVEVERSRVTAAVIGADFPLVVLDAYWRAAAAVQAELPGCGVPWWALAGISRIEGRHGTFGGSEVDAAGNTTVRIIGIPLDGTNNTALITDSDGGTLDGDPVFDRAVGPMQFIPTTWARWGRDGDGNGVVDPHNLYDAAAAAAAYLCAAGPLTDDAGMIRAFLSYNQSQPYADTVLAQSRLYSRLPIP
jgi:membrane-bound lytic murein transglycosylase B